MSVLPINSYDEFNKIINSDHPVVIDFWAVWCGPCRAIAPHVEKWAESEETPVKFYKVDVDAQEEIAQECNIRAMPTFMSFKNGQKLGEYVGANPSGFDHLVKAAAAL
ncbi:thioredoxin [Penicillium samsonianum]|uniref:thioredoxin n=1 Tax=Penicillium samsonianum TaxID=1882272 RepID=UPI002546914B|nr:thioredoxin [Penicillium samsonianum]KAJ6133533.1 thioredoxin [Penicillium samsonianum]